MAAGKKLPARKRPQSSLGNSPAEDRLQIVEEHFRNSLGFLDKLGVSPEERAEAYARAQRPRRRPAGAAKQYLERIHGLGSLLSDWRNQPPFIDEERNPKALPIRGRGATLEALAKRYVPGMSVGEVLRVLSRYSDVKRVKSNKVALLGTSFLLVPKSADYTLATITLNLGRYAQEILHNAGNPQEAGHFDRTASVKLSYRQFIEWLKEDKERLQQQVVDNESSLKRAPSSGRGVEVGVTTYVWIERQPKAR